MKSIIAAAFVACLSILFFAASCNDEEGLQEPVSDETDPVEGVRIAWDYSSLQRLAPRNGRSLSWAGYPRVRKLNDGTFIAVYETGGNGEMIRSEDKGATWSDPVFIFQKHQYTNTQGESVVMNIANCELIQLQNGDLVAACNYRPAVDEIAPFAIAVGRSTDGGQSWTPPQVVFEGGPRFGDGCWEPAFLQLPDGELQVYFANESSFLNSNEQNISMISSFDNGITWNETVKTVSFRAGSRDGMPVPLLVDDEIIVAVEDNKSGQFKPYIVRTQISENWNVPVLADSPGREYALKETLPDEVYAGAPYLMRLPSGEVILSYQTTGGRTSDWERSTMEVAIGDHAGRNFEKHTRPFPVPIDREAKWNSISLWDDKTIVAASTTSFRSPNCEVWIMKGHIIPELKAKRSVITTDGSATSAEWGDTHPVFIGHKSETSLWSDIRYDEHALYFCALVNDKKLISETNSSHDSDGVFLYIDGKSSAQSAPGPGMFRIWCNYKGEMKMEEGRSGKWKSTVIDGVVAKAHVETGTGYQVEFKIPLGAFQKTEHSDFRFNLGLVENAGTGFSYEENIANTVSGASNTWCRVAFE